MSTNTIAATAPPKRKLTPLNIFSMILEFIFWILVSAVVILGIVAWGIPLAMGATPTTVLTQSMEPAIKAGDRVMIDQSVTLDQVRINDIVEIQPKSGDPLTYVHRVMGINLGSKGEKILITQGDNNNTPDAPVTHAEQVRGRLINLPNTDNLYRIEKLGYLTSNTAALMGVAVGLLVIGLLTLFTSSKEEEQKKRADQEELEKLRKLVAAREAQDAAAPASASAASVETEAPAASPTEDAPEEPREEF